MRAVAVSVVVGLFYLGRPVSASPDDWSQATRLFQAALAAGNEGQLEQAALKVAADNSPRAVEFLLKAARTAQPAAYWICIAALSRATDPKALSAIADEVLKGKVPGLRRDLIMAFRLCESANAVEPLLRIVKEGTPDVQVSALDELVDRGHVGVIPVLVELAQKDPKPDKELNRRFFKAIRALAKEEPEGGPAQWKAWWEKKGGDVKPDPDAGTVKRRVGETVVESVRRGRLTDYEDLRKGRKEEILVVRGESDSVQDVLTLLGINHIVLGWEKIQGLEDPNFAQYMAVFVNCGTGDWPTRQAERTRKYIADGGYLFVTDIGILQAIQPAFPGFIDTSKGGGQDLRVGIVPCKGSTGHPLLRGVDLPLGMAPQKARLEWQIDGGGPSIGFDPSKVVPLVDAPDLAKKRRPTTVAAYFAYGEEPKVVQEAVAVGGVYEEFAREKSGKVLCVLSHFVKQRTNEDGFVLQNLLLNFLIEARDRKLMREARKDGDGKREGGKK